MSGVTKLRTARERELIALKRYVRTLKRTLTRIEKDIADISSSVDNELKAARSKRTRRS